MERRLRATVACAATLVCLLSARNAEATTNPTCKSLTNPIIISGSSAVKTYVTEMGVALSSQVSPSTLVYSAPGSCAGVTELTSDPDATVACASGSGGCATGNGTYYITTPATLPANCTASGTVASCTCTFETDGTSHVDVAVSDVFLESCAGGTAPSGFQEVSGPVEAMTFVVPKAATMEQAIVAEEAYFVFGFPMGGMVAPWTNPTDVIIRSQTSGTQTVIADAIGVPAAKMLGVNGMSNSGVLMGLEQSTAPNATIGILGCDFYDANRSTLTQLAFRTYGQKHAYYADSAPTSFDKQNVRDGHYLPWGYAHFITRANPSANAAAVIGMVQNTAPVTGFTPIDAAIAAHFVPQCAMAVSRTTDGGQLSLYSDAAPCDCYYDSKIPGATLPAACTACTADATCGSGKCRYGYCEPR